MNDVMVFALAALIELPGVTHRVRPSYRCTRTTWAMRSRVCALPVVRAGIQDSSASTCREFEPTTQTIDRWVHRPIAMQAGITAA